MVKDKTLLEFATQFMVDENIYIEKRSNNSWCVKVVSTILDRDLNRYYEPFPSNQSDEFKRLTRFTLDEAFAISFRYIDKIKNENKKGE